MSENMLPVNPEALPPSDGAESAENAGTTPATPSKPVKNVSTTRTVLKNMTSLVASDVVNRITSFVIYALVGRFLGAFAFGQISLALSLFYTFHVFAVAGMKTLVTREVARDKDSTGKYLVTSSFLVLFTTFLSLLGLLAFIDIMGYNSTPELTSFGLYTLSNLNGGFDALWDLSYGGRADTALVILIICMGLLPYALSQVMEAVFQAHEEMTYIAYVNAPANIIRIALIFLLTSGGYGLYSIAIMMLISHVLVMAAELYFLLRYIVKPKLQLNREFTVSLMKKSITFFGIDAILAIMSSIYLILLARFLNESAVGLFSSATQIMTPMIILYRSIILSVFPIMCQRFDVNNSDGMRRIASRLLEMLMILAIPMSVGVYLMAEWGLSFLYGGEEFTAAANAVRVIVFVVLIQSISAVFGRVLFASLREKTSLRITSINLAISVVAGVLLIPRYGVMGAAYAQLIVIVVGAIQHYIPVSRMLRGLPLLTLIWKPAIAAGAMGLYIQYFYIEGGQNALLTVAIASVIYFVVLIGVMVMSIGGPRQIRARYLGV